MTINLLREGSLIVDFNLIVPGDSTTKVLVVETVYKLVNGIVFVNYSGEIVNVTSVTLQQSSSPASKLIVTLFLTNRKLLLFYYHHMQSNTKFKMYGTECFH